MNDTPVALLNTLLLEGAQFWEVEWSSKDPDVALTPCIVSDRELADWDQARFEALKEKFFAN